MDIAKDQHTQVRFLHLLASPPAPLLALPGRRLTGQCLGGSSDA